MKNKAEIKSEKIQIWVTPGQKNKLKRAAELSQKSLSEYLIGAALSTTIDTEKIEFYQNINSSFLHLKKDLHIAKSLLLLVGSEQLKSDEKIMSFYNDVKREAEEKFTGER